MAWVTITGAVATTATKFGGDAMNKISNMFNGSDVSDEVTIHQNVTWTFTGSALQVFDSDSSHSYDVTGGALSANCTMTIPTTTLTSDTFATLGLEQTYLLSKIDTVIAKPADPSAGTTKSYSKQVDANNDARFVIQDVGGVMTEVRVS